MHGLYRMAGVQGGHAAAEPPRCQRRLSAGLRADGRHISAPHDSGRPGQRHDRQSYFQTGGRHPRLAVRLGYQRDPAIPAVRNRVDLQPVPGNQPDF